MTLLLSWGSGSSAIWRPAGTYVSTVACQIVFVPWSLPWICRLQMAKIPANYLGVQGQGTRSLMVLHMTSVGGHMLKCLRWCAAQVVSFDHIFCSWKNGLLLLFWLMHSLGHASLICLVWRVQLDHRYLPMFLYNDKILFANSTALGQNSYLPIRSVSWTSSFNYCCVCVCVCVCVCTCASFYTCSSL